MTNNKARLGCDAWIDGAIEVLAEEGIAGLRIEVLAKRMKVTKGSFYWHFGTRNELLHAVLQKWRDGRIEDIVKQTKTDPGKALDQIYHIIDVYSASRNRRGMSIELAVRDWARRDETAAAVVAEVDEARLRCARELFVACGLTVEEASSRCMLLYAYVFGASLMICGNFVPDLRQHKQEIADLIARRSIDPPSSNAA